VNGEPDHEQQLDKLYRKIGQMQIDNDFLKKAYEKLK